MNESLIIKGSVVNSPAILAAGLIEAVVTGQYDTAFTEQELTPIPINVRNARGSLRILLQMEHQFGTFIDVGRGVISLYTKVEDGYRFRVFAVHNLPEGTSRNLRVHWFAFGYEDYQTLNEYTEGGSGGGAAAPYAYPRQEVFAAVIDTITLAYPPVNDATLIVWIDRLPAFNGVDFTVADRVITLNEPLEGIESVVVSYTWRPE